MERTPRLSRRRRPAPRPAGQSLPEFLIVVPVFLFLLLLIFQMVLIYRAKTTLDYATLEAARAGAVNGADPTKMKAGLARGLTPLYATGNGAVDVGEAFMTATTDLILNADIDIISPTRQSWNEFRELQYDGRPALPNDNLAFREKTVGASGVNVQDANILKIRVKYDFPLIVPFVDRVLRGKSDYVKPDGWFDPGVVDLKDPLLSGPIMSNYFRIPLESYAIVRMQTPIYDPAPLP